MYAMRGRGRFGYFALLIDKAEAAGDTAAVTLLKVRHGHWRRMFVHTMEARRTFRFFASSGPITTMRKAVCPWGEEWYVRGLSVLRWPLFLRWPLCVLRPLALPLYYMIRNTRSTV